MSWAFRRRIRPFCTWNQSEVGKLIASESQRARDCQQESIVGDVPGSFRSDPAGMITSRPLRVACGSGEPHSRQNDVEKLRAKGKSNRATCSCPESQRKACGKTYAFAANALPVARRHREQWHFTNLMNGRSTSNSTNPQRHPPRTDMSPISITGTSNPFSETMAGKMTVHSGCSSASLLRRR